MEPFCKICKYYFKTYTKVRQHHLAEHYDYVLAQCQGDKELLREWTSLELDD